MGWASTGEYYRLLNEEVGRRLGGNHAATCVLWSVDMGELEPLQEQGRWDEAGAMLADAARRLEGAGAELLLLCTNTMHLVAPAIEAAVSVPLLHIVDVTARAVLADGITTVGLLGTRYTMEADFYRARLERHGLEVVVPGPAERAVVHDVIFGELVRGVVDPASRAAVDGVVDGLLAAGAGGVILGCTELELLVPWDSRPGLYPTSRLHVLAAVDAALG